MIRREDERAVTVQIGAILLLAIVFSALALYQVNAVPDQNRGVEFDHNERVHTELQDLRNAIQNVGTNGGTQSTSVTLGTQYPTRTVATNPPPPTGTLETTGTETVRIDNATVAANEDDYDGSPDNLLGGHNTTTLAYTPSYHEYQSAPTTRIEHGFAFNDFDGGQLSLTGQPLVSNRSITLVLLEGEFSRSAGGTVSLDPTALSGPSDRVPIEPKNEGDNITITIPTDSSTVWNDTIGTTFENGQFGAKVDRYDSNDGSSALTIELANDQYDLQVARVRIDGDGERDDRYDVHEEDDGSDTGDDPPYRVSWQDPSGQSSVSDEECDADSCVVTGDSVDLAVETDGTAVDAAVEYAVSDTDVGSVSPNADRTDSDGTHETTFDVNSGAEDGDTVTVYTSSGSDGDRMRLEISRGPFFGVAITETTDPVEVGETLEVDVEVENTGGDASEQTLSFELEDDGTTMMDDEWTVSLESGERATHTFEWNTEAGDEGEYLALVAGDTDSDAAETTVVAEGYAELESGKGWAVKEHHRQGLQEAGFEWELSERADIELRILDEEGGTLVGSETITNADTAGETTVSVTDGSNQGGEAEDYPVWLEIGVTDTGESCGSELVENDARIDLCE